MSYDKIRNGEKKMNMTKFQGIFPAFYACYDESGEISPEAVKELTRYLLDKGVTGLYVGGSSGECIYHSVEERQIVLENVMEAAAGKLTVIAHVACNNTADSCRLAAHAERMGVDAIASIPPIYFHLPQLAGVSLTMPLLREMKKNPRVIGVKNSSMPVQDIQMFHDEGFIVFNGPDEQLVAGLSAGAIGGIGGTYAGMPELFIKARELYLDGQVEKAANLQNDICRIIYKMCSGHGNMYAVIKEIIRKQGGPDCGGVRLPLAPLTEADKVIAAECVQMIEAAIHIHVKQ